MREILFRGKRNPASPWIYGNFARLWIYNQLTVFINDQEVQESSVGEYTGLLDKNGNRIFEGDIVRIRYSFSHNVRVRSVVFRENFTDFEFNPNDPVENPDGDCLCCDYDRCEVIGNIYDNPELLER